MKKTFHINEKRLSTIYNRRIFLANIPSLSVILSLLVIVALSRLSVGLDINIPSIIYKAIFYGTYFSAVYSFIVCLIGSMYADILLKAHREHTSIEISDSLLIISELGQTVRCEGRLRHCIKLWIIDFNDIEKVEYVKNYIIIHGKARYFYEDAAWLKFERTENGVDFDNWWYNSNGGRIIQDIEIHDYYTDGERIAQRIVFCRNKIAERTRRREEYRRQMLEIAKNTKHRRGISDKYVPPYKQKRRNTR